LERKVPDWDHNGNVVRIVVDKFCYQEFHGKRFLRSSKVFNLRMSRTIRFYRHQISQTTPRRSVFGSNAKNSSSNDKKERIILKVFVAASAVAIMARSSLVG